MLVLYDTSVLIPAVLPGHPHHEPSKVSVKRVVSRKVKGFLSLHTLAEFFSSLTRMPIEVSVDPYVCRRLIRDDLVPHFVLIDLDVDDYQKALDRVVESGLKGGAIHDALILQAALKKKIPLVVTWNKKHFERLADGAVKVESPETLA